MLRTSSTESDISRTTLLTLPTEIREPIYIDLFKDEILECPVLIRKQRKTLIAGVTWRYNRLPTFIPVDLGTRRYSILLTCRQLYDEGVVLYYRHATISGFYRANNPGILYPLPYHALKEDHHWFDQTIPAGLTSNLAMVLEHSRNFIEYSKDLIFSPYQFWCRTQSMKRLMIHVTEQAVRGGAGEPKYYERPSQEGLDGRVFTNYLAHMLFPDEDIYDALSKVLAVKRGLELTVKMKVTYVDYVEGARRLWEFWIMDLPTQKLLQRTVFDVIRYW